MSSGINADNRRKQAERRKYDDRRTGRGTSAVGIRYPSWKEQCVQFLTRYVFLLLGVLFFNQIDGITPAYWSLTQLNIAFGAYFLVNSALFLHARLHPLYSPRFYIAMWLDIAMVSIAVLNDPYVIPPSLLVYIMVVLGNGMRYGIRQNPVNLNTES